MSTILNSPRPAEAPALSSDDRERRSRISILHSTAESDDTARDCARNVLRELHSAITFAKTDPVRYNTLLREAIAASDTFTRLSSILTTAIAESEREIDRLAGEANRAIAARVARETEESERVPASVVAIHDALDSFRPATTGGAA